MAEYTNLHNLSGDIIDVSFTQTTPHETAYARLLYAANTVFLAGEAGDLTHQMLANLQVHYDEFVKAATAMGVDDNRQ